MATYSIIENKEREIRTFSTKTEKQAKLIFKEFLEEAPKYEDDTYTLVKEIALAFIQ